MKRIGFVLGFLLPFSIAYSQTGPAGVNLSSNSVWLSADFGVTIDASNGVVEWENRMGIANLNMLGIGANKPTYETAGINGLPTISFNDDLLESSGYLSTDYFPSANEATIIIVSKADVLNQNSTLYGTYPLATNRFSGHLPWNSRYYFDFGTCCGGAQRLTDTFANVSAVAGTYYIWGATFTASGRTAYLDNSAVKTTTLTGTFTGHAIKKFQIGGEGEDPYGQAGDIAEFILYSDDLNEAQRIIINNYLSAKYNLTISADYYADATYTFDVIGIGTDDGTNKHTASGNGSSGLGLSESNTSLNAATEYVFAGHDNSTNTASVANLGAGVEERWLKDWRIEKTGNVDALVSFDFSEGINGLYPQNSDDYLLLRLNAGTYEDVGIANGNKSVSGDKIIFDVSDVDLTNGYYTLGTADQSASPVFGKSLRTWYSYQSGNWNDPNTWTLDGGVTPLYDNAGSEIPSADEVVNITSGRKVTIQAITNNIEITEIDVAGELDLTTSTGHSFNKITGNGVITTSAATDNFPGGNAADFADASSGGTFRIDGSDITLGIDREFNNMEIELGNVADVATLVSDYNINGTLTITNGILQINDNSNTAQINLNLQDLLVESNGKITVGTASTIGSFSIPGNLPTVGNYHSIFHRVNIHGNFTNNGEARFTNQAVPDYSQYYNGGAASVYFKGDDGKVATLNGITDFYNIIIDKGSDKTYVFELNSASTSNFGLYGANYASWNTTSPYTSENPEVRKAIWIKNGTLKLTGDLVIPTLNEGNTTNGDFIIPQNGALWIDGSGVDVRSTALTTDPEVAGHTGVTDGFGWATIGVYGKFQLSEGAFSTKNADGGLAYWSTSFAEIAIEGGTLVTSKVTNVGSGAASYSQSGGTVTLTGDNSNGDFDLDNSNVIFNMSAGEIILDEGDVLIGSDPGNYSVTGGLITFNMSGNANINSTSNLWDVELVAQSGTRTLTMQKEVVISNDLTIGANTILDSDTGNNYDLTIGADFTIDAAGTYTANSNTTTLDGVKISNLDFGSLVTFNNFIVNKDVESQMIEIDNGAATAIQIDGTFSHLSGTFNYKSFVVNAKSSVFVSDTLGVLGETGQLLLDASSLQTISSSSGAIGNIEIDNSNGVELTVGSLTVFETLTMTNGIFDINTQQLVIGGSSGNISGTGFGTTKMIQTDGNASDGGLSMYLDANETLTYPIGTDANADTRYTPLVAVYSSFSDDGYISVSPSDDVLATTDGTGGTMLSYYWHVVHQGFSTVPKVTSYTFSGSENDDGTNPPTTYPNSWRAGKVLSESPYTRSREDNTSINNPTGHDINFDGDGTPFDLENADYSAGPPNRFNGAPGVYYSRVADGTWTDWDLNSTWSTDPILQHEGAAAGAFPGAGDIAVIGSVYFDDGAIGRHQLAADVDIDVAQIIFDSKAGAHPSDVTAMSRLRVELGVTVTVSTASGKGEFVPWIRNNGGTQTEGMIIGDLGDFIKEDSSGFFYWIRPTTNQRITVTDRFEFPWLRIFGGNQNAELTFNNDVTALGLVIDNTATLAVTNDYDIQGQAIFGANRQGSLLFDDNGSNDTFQCDSLYFQTPTANNNTLTVDATGTDVDVLIVEGNVDIENASSIDLSSAGSNVILELQSTGNHSFSNTSGTTLDLYQISMNKGSDQTSTFSFDDDFTINAPSASIQPIVLQNGTLILNNAAIGAGDDLILTNATNNTSFNIPATAALQISAGKAIITGTNIGITLDGLLQIDGTGELDMSGGSNNYIEYSASGNASIIVDAGTLIVGSQIRRSTIGTTGVLNYSQSGGTVVVGKESAPESTRGVFEVLNTGSSMTLTGGDFTIVRQNGGAPTTAALYLDPGTSDFTGSTITIGSTDTPITQTEFNLNIVPTINNIVFSGSNTPTSKLVVNAINIGGDITINTGHTFDASGFGVSIAGDFINDGIYSANGNMTTFNGTTTQDYSGSGSETFYDVIKDNISALTANKAITIANDLTLSAGTFSTGTNAVTVQGNAVVDIDVSSTSGNGLVFQGASEQFLSRSISGSNTIDILTIDNGLGVTIPSAGNSFTIDDNLRLSAGKFKVGSNLLTLSGSCDIEEVSSFSDVNMIQTNSSFSDNGVKKFFPSIASSTNFIFPVGESIYTPADFTISNMDQGDITVRPANEMHISIIEDIEAPDPEIVDADNALQYHWVIGASNIASLTGTATFTFDPSDAVVSGGGYTLANYIPAILLDATTAWDKGYGTADFDEGANNFTITFTSVSNAGIAGVYTAGISVDGADNPINGAIPDNIALYETNSTGGGDYDVGATWTTAIPVGGPIGGQITVKTGDELVLNNDNVRLSRTIIESGSTLTVDETTQHRLGTITGTGTLNITSSTTNAIFPAGDYSAFFDCTGGGLEYSGTGSYSIMSGLTSVRNLSLTGSGDRNLANNDVIICEDFLVNGPIFNNANNRTVTVTDQLTITSGTFNASTGTIDVNGDIAINGGTYNHNGGGITDFAGELTISSGTFNAGTGGQVLLYGDLTFTGGAFNGGSSSASVEFRGASVQDVTGDYTGGDNFYRLRMFGSGIRLNNSIEIEDRLTLDNGIINGNGNTVTLGSGITVSPSSSGQSNSYVNGRVLKTLTSIGSSFTFPIGSALLWRPASVKNVSIGGLTWEAEYFQNSPTSEALVDNLTPTNPGQIATISDGEYWKISDGNGTPSGATATIGLSWGLESDVSSFSSEREELQVMAWNDGATTWDNYGGTNFSGGHTQSSGSFEASSALDYSSASENIITLGSADIANPLPIELLSFKAVALETIVKITWETASELDNDFFTVSRSKDNLEYEQLGTVTGAGSTTSIQEYTFYDERPYDGISYYQLSQTDFDGTEVVVGLVSVKMDHTTNEVVIISYPNPFGKEAITVVVSGLNPDELADMVVFDEFGKQILTDQLKADGAGYLDIEITAARSWNSGLYIINLATEKGLIHWKVIKY